MLTVHSIIKMELQSITKGNFNLEQTQKTFSHANNLRFHFQKDGRYFEYAVDTINKKTINMQCTVHKQDHIKKGRPLTFGRTCQMVIFALSNRVMVDAFFKNLPPKKSSF